MAAMLQRPELIQSLADDRLDPYRDLKDRELAAQGGLFIAEGENLVRRLLASDFEVHSVLASEARAARISEVVPPTTPFYAVPEALMTRVLGFKFHSGILACGVRRAGMRLEALRPDGGAGTVESRTAQPGAAGANGSAAEAGATLLMCPEVINHENLGAMMRVATAFGAAAMILGQQSSDPFWRRSIRVSMGTIFSLPIVRSSDIDADLRTLGEWGYELVAAVTDADAKPLVEVRRPVDSSGNRVAIVVGCEAQGLDPRHVAMCHRRVTIPMQRGTDSLNIASAAAVFLYHFTQVAAR